MNNPNETVHTNNAVSSFPDLELFVRDAIKYGSIDNLLSKSLLLMGTLLGYVIPTIKPIPNRIVLEWWNKRTNKSLSLELIGMKDRMYWWTQCGNVLTDRKEADSISSFVSEVLLPFISDNPKSLIADTHGNTSRSPKLKAIDLPRA